jgi:hypothetical protein
MTNRRRFELRCGDKKWAILWASVQGKILEHSLSEYEVQVCPGLDLFDENEKILSMKDGGVGKVSFCSRDGAIQLNLRCDDSDLTDVIDPTGKVRLAVTLGGAGSGRDSNIVDGDHVLVLQWLK